MAVKFDVSRLNPAQKEAVMTVDGALLILAGAGTGKTRTVTARIAWMLDEGIPASQILAVTFTNKAATEMRERSAASVSKAAARDLTVCTFHSLCVRLLRGGGIGQLGYKENFSICGAGEQQGIIRKLMTRHGGKVERSELRRTQAAISSAKNAGLKAEEMEDEFFAGLRVAYDDELRALNAVDFDDLLLLSVSLLETDPSLAQRWQERFQRVTVDEFQDTNSLQMRLLKALVPERGHICVVGDDDQSIYGWRGAVAENILEFERFFPNPKIIRLEQNYRSTTPILHTANSLIRHNVGRREKTLWSEKKGQARIRSIAMPGENEEAEFIAQEILEKRHTEKRRFEDFALLMRTNRQSRRFEAELRQLNIPYRIIGGQSFYDRREIRDLLSLLGACAKPEDDLPLLRICNVPPRGISKATIGLASEESRQRRCSVWEVFCDESWRKETLSTKAAKAVASFVENLQTWRGLLLTPSRPLRGSLQDILQEIEYEDYLQRSCSGEAEFNQRREAISEFLQGLQDFDAKEPLPTSPRTATSEQGESAEQAKSQSKLQRFLDAAALQNEREQEGEDIETQQGVCLITLHAAKGLEFPLVYLVGLEQGNLPHQRALDLGTLDEERRLFYVGITRAMEELTITHCFQRKRWGDMMPCLPSQFLQELDKEYLDEINWQEIQDEPLTEDESAATFAALYEMLGEGEEQKS